MFHLYLTNHHEPNDAYNLPRCALIKLNVRLGDHQYTIPPGSVRDCVSGGYIFPIPPLSFLNSRLALLVTDGDFAPTTRHTVMTHALIATIVMSGGRLLVTFQ